MIVQPVVEPMEHYTGLIEIHPAAELTEDPHCLSWLGDVSAVVMGRVLANLSITPSQG